MIRLIKSRDGKTIKIIIPAWPLRHKDAKLKDLDIQFEVWKD